MDAGLRFSVRFVKASAAGRDNADAAAAFAASQRWLDSERIAMPLKTAVAGMTVASNAALVNDAGLTLVAASRPQAIIGKLMDAVQRVPFEIPFTGQLNVTPVGAWLGEGQAAPVARGYFEAQVSLPRLKIGVIFAVTDELLKSNAPAADVAIANALKRNLVRFEDQSFISTAAGSAGVQPASVTYGEPSFVSSGSAAAQIAADLKLLVASLVANGSDLASAYWIMDAVAAAHLAGLADSFPNVSVAGGTLMGLPVIVSASLQRIGSPGTGYIVLLDAAAVVVADDGGAEITTSKRAAIEFLDNPTNSQSVPTPTNMVSLWQTGSTAVRVSRWINWARTHDGAAAVLTGVTF